MGERRRKSRGRKGGPQAERERGRKMETQMKIIFFSRRAAAAVQREPKKKTRKIKMERSKVQTKTEKRRD